MFVKSMRPSYTLHALDWCASSNQFLGNNQPKYSIIFPVLNVLVRMITIEKSIRGRGMARVLVARGMVHSFLFGRKDASVIWPVLFSLIGWFCLYLFWPCCLWVDSAGVDFSVIFCQCIPV